MTQEAYVSLETAKLLKEKGFDEDCYMYHPIKGGEVEELTLDELNYHRSQFIKAPTQSMAMKWLREEKRTSIIIEFDVTKRGYCPYVYQLDYDMDWVVKWRVNTPMNYEEACETAIKYCLENLI